MRPRPRPALVAFAMVAIALSLGCAKKSTPARRCRPARDARRRATPTPTPTPAPSPSRARDARGRLHRPADRVLRARLLDARRRRARGARLERQAAPRQPGWSRTDRRPLRRARHGRVQPGPRREARELRAATTCRGGRPRSRASRRSRTARRVPVGRRPRRGRVGEEPSRGVHAVTRRGAGGSHPARAPARWPCSSCSPRRRSRRAATRRSSSLLRSGLDSLRAQVDTIAVRDSVAARLLGRHAPRSGRAARPVLQLARRQASTQRDLADLMSRLDGRLDEITSRVTKASERAGVARPPVLPPTTTGDGASTPAASGTGTPATARHRPRAAARRPRPARALRQASTSRPATSPRGATRSRCRRYRDFLSTLSRQPSWPTTRSTASASASSRRPRSTAPPPSTRRSASAGRRATARPPPSTSWRSARSGWAASAEARKTFEDLVKRFPASSEAGLARDRIGATRR